MVDVQKFWARFSGTANSTFHELKDKEGYILRIVFKIFTKGNVLRVVLGKNVEFYKDDEVIASRDFCRLRIFSRRKTLREVFRRASSNIVQMKIAGFDVEVTYLI